MPEPTCIQPSPSPQPQSLPAPVAHAPPGPELRDLEGLGTVEQVGQVEVDYVVAYEHVGVGLQHQVAPAQQQLALVVIRHHLCRAAAATKAVTGAGAAAVGRGVATSGAEVKGGAVHSPQPNQAAGMCSHWPTPLPHLRTTHAAPVFTCAGDGRAGLECHDVAHCRRRLPKLGDKRGDLDDRVLVRLGEVALQTGGRQRRRRWQRWR